MLVSVTACVILVLGLMQPVRVSLFDLPEDLEASGYDMEDPGSGDDPVPGTTVPVTKTEKGSNTTIKDLSDKNTKNPDWPPRVSPSEHIIIKSSKSFLENKEIAAGFIAGGITGTILGATLSALLIYKWRKKHEEEGFLSQKRASDDYY